MMTIVKFIEHIEQNLHKKINIASLIAKTGYSYQYFQRIFNQSMNASITTYIRKRRLTLASVMLRNTSRPITDLALMYQFEHLQSFSRAFTMQFGISPKKYRQATMWNMSYFYPSAIVKDFSCQAEIIHISGEVVLQQKLKTIWKKNLGLNFYIVTDQGKIVSYKELYQHSIDLLFTNNMDYPLCAVGDMIPGEDCDTIIEIYTGQLTVEPKHKNILPIASGYYTCFSFTGNPHDIMMFHAWAKGHGMHKYGVTLKKGPTFSVFDRTRIEGVYKTEYYVPCHQ